MNLERKEVVLSAFIRVHPWPFPIVMPGFRPDLTATLHSSAYFHTLPIRRCSENL